MSSDFAARHPRLAELFGLDLRSLALFRFLLGATLSCLLCGSLCDLGALYSDNGALPRGWVMASDSPWRLSLYFLNGTAAFAGLLLLAQIALAAMLALGWRTRLAAVAGFLLQASLLSRAPLAAGSADLLLTGLLFWSAFLPLGARWSVDAALAANPPPQDPQHISWAGAGLLLQVLSVYFFSALLRSGPEWHAEGTALYYLLAPDGHATALGRWLLPHTGLLSTATAMLWWLTLLAAPLVLLPFASRYTRMLVLPLLALMHLGLLLTLKQGALPLLGLAGLAALLPAGFWAWCQRRPAAPGLRIYHDRERPSSLRHSLLLQQFLVLPQAQIIAAQDAPRARALLEANRSWVVIDTDDQAHLRWAALAALLRHSPLFSWLHRPARLAAVERLGDRLHAWVAARPAAPPPPGRREVSWEVSSNWQRNAGAFLGLLLIWNAATVGWLPAATHRTLAPLMQALRLDQAWNMDAPSPSRDGGWFVAAGRLEDGREIDLLREGAAPDYGQAPSYDDGLAWRRLRERLALDGYAAHRPYYARYLCGQASHDGPRLLSVKLVHVLVRTPPPGGTAAQPEQRVLLQRDCAAWN